MNGRIVGSAIIAMAIAAGAGLYYTQVYYYYDDVVQAKSQVLSLTAPEGDAQRDLAVTAFQAVEKSSSPLGYRACFTVPNSLAMLTETYAMIDGAVPLVAPDWFDCFDATEIGEALVEGRALAFMGQEEIADGVDRVIAVMDDGRGFSWHQLNEKYKD